MPSNRRELVTHFFHGGRYEDKGLDLDSLSDLIAFKTLLVETAKELWRQNHPDKQRLPRNFEDGLRLKFYELRQGSVGVPLVRELPDQTNCLPFDAPPDELDEASDLCLDVIETSGRNERLPERFPKKLLPLFENYGKTLEGDECFLLQRPGDARKVKYDKSVQERLAYTTEGDYEDVIEVVGEVRAADLDGRQFTLRLSEQEKVSGRFTSEQEMLIVNALQDHSFTRLHVKGRALLNSEGKTKRLIGVEEIRLQPPGETVYDATARPIWEIAVEIGESVPDEEWAKVPTDLSLNFNHYLYGAPREEP